MPGSVLDNQDPNADPNKDPNADPNKDPNADPNADPNKDPNADPNKDSGIKVEDFVKDKWRETIPADLKDRAEWKNVTSLEDVYKNYIEGQKTISSSVRVPTAQSSPEEVVKFYEKLGKPKAAEDYKMDVPQDVIEKGLTPVQDMTAWFKQKAFEKNLTTEQAESLYKDFTAYQIEQHNKMVEQITKETNTATDKLKAEWGGDFQKNVEFINSKLESLFDKDSVASLRNSGMLRDVNFIKNLYKLTKAVSGDMVYIDGKPVDNSKETLETLTTERDKLMSEDYLKNKTKVEELNKKIVLIKQAQQKRPMS